MKVVADRTRCVGAGQCVLAAPEVFDQDEDGIVMLLDDAPAESEHESVREAARACPATVIELQ